MRRKIPSLQALACFDAAARHESYTRAAQELALTQSAVSRQIAALEGYLGQALFRRTRHGVALTERGSWSVTTGSGARIVIGDREQAGRRLHRFLDVYPQLIAGHADGFVYADLRYTNGFAVRWPDAAGAPAGGSPRS